MREKIIALINEIETTLKSDDKSVKLPQNTFYLSNDRILSCKREKGTTRYPYGYDGFTIWLYNNGVIEAWESTFNLFKPIHYCEEPSIHFFGGIKSGEKYIPVSLFETTKQLNEENIKRYTVYENKCAWYLADTKDITFALRIFVTEDKKVIFTSTAINKSNKVKEIYLLSCFETILANKEHENFWDKMNKYSEAHNGATIFRNWNNRMVIKPYFDANPDKVSHTVGKTGAFGNVRAAMNSDSLLNGCFTEEKISVNMVDTPVAANLFCYTVKPGDEKRVDIVLFYSHDEESAQGFLTEEDDIKAFEKQMEDSEKEYIEDLSTFNITFKDYKGDIHPNVLNRFIKNVQKQVSFCAMGKNFDGVLIGMRDVMQQLEGALMWQPLKSRAKLASTLNFVLDTGRPPRRFSYSETPNAMPTVDLDEYIDQGPFVISTFYNYLAYTNDFSILNEKCSYFIAKEDNSGYKARTDYSDTVLDHLIRTMDYLCSELDDETDCLHILHGDWNDAIDRLGATQKAGKRWGNGVTVMASAQMYRNCREIIEILNKVGGYEDLVNKYSAVKDRLEKGLIENAIAVNHNGEKRILHGWGDDHSYFLGSFNDPDGVSRISSTSHSLWAICGLTEKDNSTKEVVLNAFKRLDSKYGLLTFDKPFLKDSYNYFGRISTITPGIAENFAAYIHASIFGSMALFEIGESKMAWEQVEKSIIITHENCSKTPFVMPNSYCCNPDYTIDGESMGDWYTGSGTTLIKELVGYGFGIKPNLDGIKVEFPNYFPANEAKIELKIKGKNVKVSYKNTNAGERKYTVNGKIADTKLHELANTKYITLANDEITDNTVIEITD